MDKQTLAKLAETLNVYQNSAATFAIYPGRLGMLDDSSMDGLYYTAMGLAGESGEYLEKLFIYGRTGQYEKLKKILNELGDFCWFISQCAMELSCCMSHLIQHVSIIPNLESSYICIYASQYCEVVKKCMRDNHAHITKETRRQLLKILGSCLSMVISECCYFSTPLEVVFQLNIEKLSSRKERNVLQGQGDNR